MCVIGGGPGKLNRFKTGFKSTGKRGLSPFSVSVAFFSVRVKERDTLSLNG
jgi:hypothetical protein